MPSILIVEDDPVLRFVLAEFLRSENHDVMEAASADEAVEILSSAAVVDLLITDVEMPGSMDGLALARRVRANRPSLPVIVVSGWGALPDLRGLGLSAFFRKPYDLDNVAAHIASLALDRNTDDAQAGGL
jgi:CheY-like chemotaxis protein